MKNQENWKPSKFVYAGNNLTGSRDPREVGIASRIMADCVATHYQTHLKTYARGRLADLGCGKVPLFEAYRQYVSDVTCVDWSNSIHRNPYLDIECDLNASLPMADASFDTIILSDVLEHIHQPGSLWSEMSRILTKGGHVLMNAPFYYPLHEAPHDYYRYTEFSLRKMAETAGFRVILITATGGVPEILADITAKNIQRIRWLGPLIAKFIQKTCSLFLQTSRGRRLSSKTAKTFPFGYFLVAEKQ